MARVIIHKEKRPVEVKVGDKSVWICRCGLTTNPPYCSGKHKEIQAEEDDKLFLYEEGKRYEVEIVKK
ncbi:MAG: CDGSH iron-sulfur domain-containing protein [Candidatus Calescibacterium sp.]|nr:CDGSH iron-sulfur domain-containing protein [Candidatus Calescibacterium sp.]MCX7733820.1 CDGSH iron-sulfur domain-containing protein [bacterium]MDW8086974.1 CDGSH iron-sulfur domain-containing protein [Candidatus Calescibacterium sp.]